MVEYYHPNCGHCQTLKPEWEKMCFEMKKNYRGKATIAAVDCSDQEMLNKLHIDKDYQGFPTIFHMRDGKSVQEYKGDRTKDALIRFAENSLPVTLQKQQLKPALPFVFSPSRSVVLRKYGKGSRGKPKRRSVKKRTSRKKSVQKKAKSIGKNIRKKITRKLRRGKSKK